LRVNSSDECARLLALVDRTQPRRPVGP
jgi:hypothetical protein